MINSDVAVRFRDGSYKPFKDVKCSGGDSWLHVFRIVPNPKYDPKEKYSSEYVFEEIYMCPVDMVSSVEYAE